MLDKFYKVFVIVAITVFIYFYGVTVNYDVAIYIGIIFFITSLIVFLLPLLIDLIKMANKKDSDDILS